MAKQPDYNLIYKVPEKFTCIICSNLLHRPHLTECCGQRFCQKCLQSWLNQQLNKTCPHCRTKNVVHIQDKPVQREINQLKVRCSHHSEGCKWMGELGDLQMHLDSDNGCGYVPLPCSNRCSVLSSIVRIQRKDLQEHLRSRCPLRKYRCEHCGYTATYQNITQQHYPICQKFPLTCPNKCGKTEIKRGDMPTHRKQCPLEPVQCPFQEVRCDIKLTRRDAKEYTSSHTQHHFELMYRRFETKCSELDQKIQSLERGCSALKEENADLTKKNRVLFTKCKEQEERVNSLIATSCLILVLVFVLFVCYIIWHQ